MHARFTAMIAVALSIAAVASPAHAQSVQFQASVQRTCVEDTAGFDANLQPNPLPANPPAGSTNFIRQTSGADFTMYTFNGDGTFSTQGTSTNIRTNNTVGESTFNCTGTFSVNAGLSLSTSASCTFQDSIPNMDSGTVTGSSSMIQITQGINLLMISSSLPPTVETVNVTVPGGNPFSYQRVCTRAGSAGQMNPQ
jgi:hypothetical protein